MSGFNPFLILGGFTALVMVFLFLRVGKPKELARNQNLPNSNEEARSIPYVAIFAGTIVIVLGFYLLLS